MSVKPDVCAGLRVLRQLVAQPGHVEAVREAVERAYAPDDPAGQVLRNVLEDLEGRAGEMDRALDRLERAFCSGEDSDPSERG